jgi:hypothetical protein
MIEEKRKKWMELRGLAAKEQDPKRLMTLIGEMLSLLLSTRSRPPHVDAPG